MTLMRPESAVLSQLLCDLPDAPAPVGQQVQSDLLRALGLVERTTSTDYADTVAAGYVESLDAWAARVLGES